MAGSEFVEVLVGVGSARIRDLFKRAKVTFYRLMMLSMLFLFPLQYSKYQSKV